tara:strand:- start:2252 stop:2602 length:351 start_codon:yes stop_codon:yes gene_type:complete
MTLSKTNKRKIRNRKKLKKFNKFGKFRISVFKTSKNISAQIIDDKTMKTIASASSIEKNVAKNKKKMEISNIIGEMLAKRAKDLKIDKVYFDRGGYKYHGRIKAFADSLRKNGVKF